jgi:hypothetical protein
VEGCLGQGNTNTGTRGRVESIHALKAFRQEDGARYCVLKVLNTRGQYLEVGKNVPL